MRRLLEILLEILRESHKSVAGLMIAPVGRRVSVDVTSEWESLSEVNDVSKSNRAAVLQNLRRLSLDAL